MKKIIAIVLIIGILLIGSLSACSDNGDDPEQEKDTVTSAEEETENTEESYYDALGEFNFSGDEFTILDANWNIELWQNMPAEEGLNGEAVNDAMYMRDKFIEEKYEIEIKYIQIAGSNTGTDALKNDILAGDNTYDMVVSTILGGNFGTLAVSNILYNMIDAPYLSLQSPWWSKLLYDNIKFNDRLYFTGGDIMPSLYQAPAAMFVNMNLLDDYGVQENLYDLVFEGKWTLDILETITKDLNEDLNNDGNMHADDDFYGLIHQNNSLTTDSFYTALGMKLSTLNDNSIAVDINSPNSIEIIDRLSALMSEIKYVEQNDIITKTFNSGRALFLAHFLECALKHLRNMEDDYGILPMPKYTENQENYTSFINAWNSSFVAIPINADAEKSALIMEAMGYASYEMIRPSIYEVSLKTKVTRDSESARAIDIIIETCYLDLNSVYGFGGSNAIICNAIILDSPFASAYAAKESAITADIEKFIEQISKQ